MLDLIKDDFTKIADRCAEVSSELGGTNLNGADGKVESAMKGCRSRTVMQGFESVFTDVAATDAAVTDAGEPDVVEPGEPTEAAPAQL
ncbi:hypothetical protein [Corynebacterium sp. 20_84]